MTLLAGIAAAGLLWWLLKTYIKSNPTLMARNLKRAGGVAALGAAALLLLRGRIDIAIPLGGFGAYLLDLPGLSLPGWGQRTQSTPGGTSKVRSLSLEMELDHASGELRGWVVSGPFQGRALETMSEGELAALSDDCRVSDPDGVRLLEAYLDRRFPGRRKAAQDDADARGAPARDRSAMSEKEAYDVLGLQPGAGEEEIRNAHRALMKKLHPDHGGSTYLATRVNQAKDVLLSRHR